ncbi:plant expansin [Collybia nuda]|uniref:Plant expansin n=1 Tax=Collybia nuda TaxID=64659 RepID=A0A9P5YDS9_9AGAR|nr:plant expansin [Collybia nuda]
MLYLASVLVALSSLASVQAFTGDGTFYQPGLGACGNFNTANEFVVAMAHATYDSYPGATPNPNLNPICQRSIRATYQGKTVILRVVDRCAGCAGASDIDMSPAAFSVLAPLSAGRLQGVEWDYI